MLTFPWRLKEVEVSESQRKPFEQVLFDMYLHFLAAWKWILGLELFSWSIVFLLRIFRVLDPHKLKQGESK